MDASSSELAPGLSPSGGGGGGSGVLVVPATLASNPHQRPTRQPSLQALNHGVPLQHQRTPVSRPVSLTYTTSGTTAAGGAAGEGEEDGAAGGGDEEQFSEYELAHAAKAAAEHARQLWRRREEDWSQNRTNEIDVNLFLLQQRTDEPPTCESQPPETPTSPTPAATTAPMSALARLHYLPADQKRLALSALHAEEKQRRAHKEQVERARSHERQKDRRSRKQDKEEAKRRHELDAEEEYRRKEREKRKAKRHGATSAKSTRSAGASGDAAAAAAASSSSALTTIAATTPTSKGRSPSRGTGGTNTSRQGDDALAPPLLLRPSLTPLVVTKEAMIADIRAGLPPDATYCSTCEPRGAAPCYLVTLSSYSITAPLSRTGLTAVHATLTLTNPTGEIVAMHLTSNAPKNIFLRPTHTLYLYAHQTQTIEVDYIGEYQSDAERLHARAEHARAEEARLREEFPREQNVDITPAAAAASASAAEEAETSSPAAVASLPMPSSPSPHHLLLSARIVIRSDTAMGFATASAFTPALFWAMAEKEGRERHQYEAAIQWTVEEAVAGDTDATSGVTTAVAAASSSSSSVATPLPGMNPLEYHAWKQRSAVLEALTAQTLAIASAPAASSAAELQQQQQQREMMTVTIEPAVESPQHTAVARAIPSEQLASLDRAGSIPILLPSPSPSPADLLQPEQQQQLQPTKRKRSEKSRTVVSFKAMRAALAETGVQVEEDAQEEEEGQETKQQLSSASASPARETTIRFAVIPDPTPSSAGLLDPSSAASSASPSPSLSALPTKRLRSEKARTVMHMRDIRAALQAATTTAETTSSATGATATPPMGATAIDQEELKESAPLDAPPPVATASSGDRTATSDERRSRTTTRTRFATPPSPTRRAKEAANEDEPNEQKVAEENQPSHPSPPVLAAARPPSPELPLPPRMRSERGKTIVSMKEVRAALAAAGGKVAPSTSIEDTVVARPPTPKATADSSVQTDASWLSTPTSSNSESAPPLAVSRVPPVSVSLELAAEEAKDHTHTESLTERDYHFDDEEEEEEGPAKEESAHEEDHMTAPPGASAADKLPEDFERHLDAMLSEWESCIRSAETRRREEAERIATMREANATATNGAGGDYSFASPSTLFGGAPLHSQLAASQKHYLRAELAALDLERETLLGLEWDINRTAAGAVRPRGGADGTGKQSPSSHTSSSSSSHSRSFTRRQAHLRERAIRIEAIRAHHRAILTDELERVRAGLPPPSLGAAPISPNGRQPETNERISPSRAGGVGGMDHHARPRTSSSPYGDVPRGHRHTSSGSFLARKVGGPPSSPPPYPSSSATFFTPSEQKRIAQLTSPPPPQTAGGMRPSTSGSVGPSILSPSSAAHHHHKQQHHPMSPTDREHFDRLQRVYGAQRANQDPYIVKLEKLQAAEATRARMAIKSHAGGGPTVKFFRGVSISPPAPQRSKSQATLTGVMAGASYQRQVSTSASVVTAAPLDAAVLSTQYAPAADAGSPGAAAAIQPKAIRPTTSVARRPQQQPQAAEVESYESEEYDADF